MRALVRPRDVALALALGLIVTLIVIWRDADRADATYVIGAVPEQPLGPIELTGVPRRSFALPRLTADGPGRVLLQIATYLQQPTATVRLQVLDARGRSLARCAFPPTSYRDNDLLPCDVPDIARARRIVVSHSGPAKLAVIAHGQVAGYLAYTSSGGVLSRMRSVIGPRRHLAPARRRPGGADRRTVALHVRAGASPAARGRNRAGATRRAPRAGRAAGRAGWCAR